MPSHSISTSLLMFTTALGAAALLPACSGDDQYPYYEGTYAPGQDAGPVGPDGSPIGGGAPSGAGASDGEGSTTNPDSTPQTITKTVCTPVCSNDTPPGQDPTCDEWKEWGMCGQEWFKGFCKKTCGSCDGEEEICEEITVTVTPSSNGSGSSRDTNPDAQAGNLPASAQSGWASRYWDCCKPHCAWKDNAPGGTAKTCNKQNQLMSDPDAQSSCNGGNAHACWSMAPWAVNDQLAYGFAATPAGGNDCGKCYQLEFTGSGRHNLNDPGSKTLAGKTMIVQATNVGGDVGSGQFDLLIPGGGVGAFNGCSAQWGTSDLGAQYGGFLTTCNNNVGCLKNKCNEVFAGKPDLLSGCLFHANWMGGADNPQLRYAEVECPAELKQVSGMN